MSNFVRVDGQTPVNMDLVEEFLVSDEGIFYSINFFVYGREDFTSWDFSDFAYGENVYLMLLNNYTTTLNP